MIFNIHLCSDQLAVKRGLRFLGTAQSFDLKFNRFMPFVHDKAKLTTEQRNSQWPLLVSKKGMEECFIAVGSVPATPKITCVMQRQRGEKVTCMCFGC